MHILRKILFLAIMISAFSGSMKAQYYGVNPSVVGEWAIGLQLGSNYLRGDVSQRLPGYQLGLYAQNSFSRNLDIKIMLEGGLLEGQGTSASQAFFNNWALNGNQDSLHFYDTTQLVFHNYQMQHAALSGAIKVNLNRLLAPSSGDNWDLYLTGGISLMLYETRVNVYNESQGTTYDYSQITATEPLDVQNQLIGLMDGTYESLAEQDRLNNTTLGSWIFRSSFLAGAGFRIRLSDQIGLGLEGRYHFILDDLLDGQQWTEENQPSLTNDHLITAGLTVDFIL